MSKPRFTRAGNVFLLRQLRLRCKAAAFERLTAPKHACFLQTYGADLITDIAFALQTHPYCCCYPERGKRGLAVFGKETDEEVMNKSHKGSTSFLGVLMGKTLEPVTRICHVNYFVSVHSTAQGQNQWPCKHAGLCYFSPGLTEASKPPQKRQKPPIKTVLAGGALCWATFSSIPKTTTKSTPGPDE